MKRIKAILMSLVLATSLGGGAVLLPAVAHADSAKQEVCQSLQAGADCNSDKSGSVSVNNLVAAIIRIMSLIIGVAAVIMIIVAGIRYVTSGGDTEAVSGAKNTIIYAVIGLIVAAMAQLLVQFVINKIG